MKSIMNIIVVGAWFLCFLPAFAQQIVRIDFYDASIHHSIGDPCKFKFVVSTHAMGPGTITANANGSFNVNGSAGSVSGSLNANATGSGNVEASNSAIYNFPGFGTLNGDSHGAHTASNGSSSTNRAFQGFTNMECELFVHDPPPPCENLLAKQQSSEPCRVSPLVLDLDRNGFRFGGPETAIHFDIYGSGTPLHMNWVMAGEDDAFLVLDVNQNSIVDDGSELFGNGTRMILQGNRLAPNGFVALGQYDMPELGGNNDGFIDHRDEIWSQLALWLDQNADGVSTADEMITPNEYGLMRLETIPRDLNQFDSWGNWLPYWATVTAMDGPMDMVDVFFRIVDSETSKIIAD